jgi:hypothetical protein
MRALMDNYGSVIVCSFAFNMKPRGDLALDFISNRGRGEQIVSEDYETREIKRERGRLSCPFCSPLAFCFPLAFPSPLSFRSPRHLRSPGKRGLRPPQSF